MWEWIAIITLFIAVVGQRFAIEKLAEKVDELSDEIKSFGAKSGEDTGDEIVT